MSLITLALVTTSAFLHYEVLGRLNDVLPRVALVPRRTKVLVAVLGAMGSHICQVALFGIAYWTLRDGLHLGGLGGQFQDVLSTYLYFSMETYTSLGFGDIYPLGPLRMMAGVEALTGLLTISWTASFTYLEMTRYWGGAESVGESRRTRATRRELSAALRDDAAPR